MSEVLITLRQSQHNHDKLVTRSHAKRLLEGVEKFDTVVFDFEQVKAVGQAFADEIFRVFKNQHPDIELVSINANENVQKMINRAGTQN